LYILNIYWIILKLQMYKYFIIIIFLITCTYAYDQVDCAREAQDAWYSTQDSISLCINSKSNDTVKCALECAGTWTSVKDCIELCRGAISLDPVYCYKKACDAWYSVEQAIQLCKHYKC